MCFIFEPRHVNIAVYLTCPGNSEPPRITFDEMSSFLATFADRTRFGTWDEARFVELGAIVERARTELHTNGVSDVNSIFRDLRGVLIDHKLFIMPIGYEPTGTDVVSIGFRRFLDHAAASSKEHALVLIPHGGGVNFAVLDPLPQVTLLADHPDKLPGLLFWSRAGAAAVVSLEEASDLYQKLLNEFKYGAKAVDSVLAGYRSPKKSKSLLHLSDTHFGSHSARVNKERLLAYLRLQISECSRVVITGDLLNNPENANDPAFAEFKEFRRWLAKESNAEVIVIPGNHDQRWHGNKLAFFGNKRDMLAELHWNQIVADHNLRSIFLCFDSSRHGIAATGQITDSQMEDMEAELEAQYALDSRLTNYVKIALLHHHPFPYEVFGERIIQRFLTKINLTEDTFLELSDRKEFARWCARNQVSVMLHGHKHIERHHIEAVQFDEPGGSTPISKELHAIGCGTSLGMEGAPISYNLLTIDPVSHRITVLFCSEDAKGGQIQRESMAVL
jgi:UDP-2,3-diacylglucosamine pyrophosphatase LpxH